MESAISGERFILASETLTYQQLFNQIADALHVPKTTRYAPPVLTSLAWQAERIGSLISGKPPQITRQTHRVAHIKDEFNGNKIKQALPLQYTPISETISFVAGCFQMSHK